MINPKKFISTLKKNKINFFTGVPDSMFSSLCSTLQIKEKKNHILSSNEGSSVGLAIGYHLATGKIPLVYLQNSGIGNMINPLISLSDKKVFRVPIFLLIGWRGEINKKKQIYDEPQHLSQGLITPKLLKLLDIKFKVINNKSNFKKDIMILTKYAKQKNKIVALLIKKNTFENSKYINKFLTSNLLTREEALKIVYKNIPYRHPKISTTGMLSRELYELNEINQTHDNTFMCVGGMGHSISISTGLALFKKSKKIFCLDGDGSILMHLGALANSGKIKNLIHVVFNNFAHDSVGGQRPPSENIEFYKVARDMGYSNSFRVKNSLQLKNKIDFALKNKKNTFIEIVCKKGHRKNLSRPKQNTLYYKQKFMKFVSKK